ncbi:hypothetical protein F5Y16DRAFT_120274 [Xylariaceae sp. FL0255]|nr:hypothetical protein F5Y16DRAFT_120274 [Xylariaceae sp. FL0255]
MLISSKTTFDCVRLRRRFCFNTSSDFTKMLYRGFGLRAVQTAHSTTAILSRSATRPNLPASFPGILNPVQRAWKSDRLQISHQLNYHHHHPKQTQRWLNNFAPRDPMPKYNRLIPNPQLLTRSRLRKPVVITLVLTIAIAVYATHDELRALLTRSLLPRRLKKLEEKLRKEAQEHGEAIDSDSIAIGCMECTIMVTHGHEEMVVRAARYVIEENDEDKVMKELFNKIQVLVPESSHGPQSRDDHGLQHFYVVVNDGGMDGVEADPRYGWVPWRWTLFNLGPIIINEKLRDLLVMVHDMFEILCSEGQMPNFQSDEPYMAHILTKDYKAFDAAPAFRHGGRISFLVTRTL